MKYIDLSHKIDNKMPVYPGAVDVSLVHAKTLLNDRHNAYYLSTSMHAGTHIDFPMHLLPNDNTADTYELDKFVGKGYLIDARGMQQIEYKDSYKGIEKGDIVLIYTGEDENYGQPEYYSNHPTMTVEFAEFLVSKEIKMLGVDMPAPDFPPFPVHKLLLSHDIFIIENLINLDQLLGIEDFEIFAQPLKICAEASLTRAFARY